MIAKTPEAPYFAVIFTSLKVSGASGYDEMALKMDELAKQQPGYLGVESVRGADGMGLTISYWKDLESISSWKRNSEHKMAQSFGKEKWYSDYKVRICKVERDYSL